MNVNGLLVVFRATTHSTQHTTDDEGEKAARFGKRMEKKGGKKNTERESLHRKRDETQITRAHSLSIFRSFAHSFILPVRLTFTCVCVPVYVCAPVRT